MVGVIPAVVVLSLDAVVAVVAVVVLTELAFRSAGGVLSVVVLIDVAVCGGGGGAFAPVVTCAVEDFSTA